MAQLVIDSTVNSRWILEHQESAHFGYLVVSEDELKNKFLTTLAAGVLAGSATLLAGSPAFASFGSLETINPTGGSTPDDGLKIEIAQTEIQVTRDGETQFYGLGPAPVAGTPGYMLNYFEVTYTDGLGDQVIGQYNGNPAWGSGTSEANLSSDGKSGTVINTLTADVGGQPVTLKVTFTYTYPNEFLNVTTRLTLPSGWNYPTRVYWNADATLGGNDDGNQFEGTLASGRQVRGVTTTDGTTIEGFRQVAGQNLFSWAGYLDCPWGSFGCTTLPTTSWVVNNADAPNEMSTATNIDNGFGISTPEVASAGNHTSSFDIFFVGCANAADPITCLDASLPTDPSPESELAATGASAGLGGLAVAALLLALAVIDRVFRRRATKSA